MDNFVRNYSKYWYTSNKSYFAVMLTDLCLLHV
jgi:hypothetical protein